VPAPNANEPQLAGRSLPSAPITRLKEQPERLNPISTPAERCSTWWHRPSERGLPHRGARRLTTRGGRRTDPPPPRQTVVQCPTTGSESRAQARARRGPSCRRATGGEKLTEGRAWPEAQQRDNTAAADHDGRRAPADPPPRNRHRHRRHLRSADCRCASAAPLGAVQCRRSAARPIGATDAPCAGAPRVETSARTMRATGSVCPFAGL